MRHGSIEVYDVAANNRVIDMKDHTGRVGSLGWNGNIQPPGSLDRLILQHDMRTPAHTTVRKQAGHSREVSRNVFKCY
jgi:hypothetical protein